ncbi:MAG TPA: hypothetical protein VGQ06_02220 [Gemmatimonadales bacterium]|nr:hypothetical protein [Gemmatimonadales bacterium]
MRVPQALASDLRTLATLTGQSEAALQREIISQGVRSRLARQLAKQNAPRASNAEGGETDQQD